MIVFPNLWENIDRVQNSFVVYNEEEREIVGHDSLLQCAGMRHGEPDM